PGRAAAVPGMRGPLHESLGAAVPLLRTSRERAAPSSSAEPDGDAETHAGADGWRAYGLLLAPRRRHRDRELPLGRRRVRLDVRRRVRALTRTWWPTRRCRRPRSAPSR